jgi:hypothetical protein
MKVINSKKMRGEGVVARMGETLKGRDYSLDLGVKTQLVTKCYTVPWIQMDPVE